MYIYNFRCSYYIEIGMIYSTHDMSKVIAATGDG